jgi:hypothetical protein
VKIHRWVPKKTCDFAEQAFDCAEPAIPAQDDAMDEDPLEAVTSDAKRTTYLAHFSKFNQP